MKRFLSIFLAIVALTFAACTNSEEDGNNSQGGNTEPIRTELTVSSTSLLFDAKDDIQALDLYSTDTWTAEFVNDRASEWCSIAPQNGQAGDSSIIVSVTENNSGEERSASIIIKAKSLQKIVKVTQKQNDALTITASKFEVEAEGGEVEIEVKANVDYEYSIEESAKSWVTFKTTRAMESSTLVFEVAENEDMEKREAQIMIHSGDLKELVTIYQEGEEPTIILSKNESTVSDKGETIAVEVKSNVDVAVEIPSDVDWVKENSTRAMSTNTYYFEVSPNEDYNSRSTSIKFTNKENNLSETVTITQVQKDAIVIAKDSYTVDNEGGEIDIEVGHNVDFDVEISHDWITMASTRAFETETLNFNIAANNSNNGREGTIKFTSKDNAITQTVIVLQEGYDPTKPRNNEIWYTTTDGNIVTLKRTKVFGAKFVSNIYENGKGIITFDGSVTMIGNTAFKDYSSLTSVTIPDSVTAIGYSAFEDCSSLTSVNITDSVTAIGDYAFRNCSSLTTITIPDSVTEIGGYTFEGCFNLTNITIPDSVTKIGRYAFGECSNLTDITIPDSVTEIGTSAFYGCSSLTTITIPDSVTTIGDSAFAFCESLTDITIPDSVTTIGNSAFYYCSSLKRITIPDSVTEIGEGVFSSCSSLTSITIPDGVTTIGDSAFSHCSSLTSITIPENITTIGNSAFSGCSSLTTITIPDSVTTIGDSAFWGCSSLTSVTIPDSVTTIGYGAFSYCNSLEAFYGKFASEDHRCLVVDDVLNSYAQVGSRVYKIPDGIKEIGRGAFYICDRILLTKVKIPNTVTTIHKKAFYQCNGFTEINIPEGTTDIRDEAFRWCHSLEKVILSSTITNMDDKVFMECEKLTSVHCKATTPPTIGTNVFSENAEGRKIYVPAESVSAYKSADGWKDYADAIVSDDNIDDYEEPDDSEFDQNIRRQKHINALRSLYEATDGDNWRRNDNWFTDKPLHEWYGLNRNTWPGSTIMVDEVVSLQLHNNNLCGTLPPEFAVLMDDVIELEIDGNGLYGQIHEKIRNHPKWQQFGWNIVKQDSRPGTNGGFDFSDGTGLVLPNGEIEFFVDGTSKSVESVLKENKLTIVLNAGMVDRIYGISDEWVNYFLDYHNKGLGLIATVSGYWDYPYDDYRNYVLQKLELGLPTDIMWTKCFVEGITGQAVGHSGDMGLYDSSGNLVAYWMRDYDISETWYLQQIDTFVRARLGEPEEHPEYNSNLYTSTDYSRDGEVVTLQKATKGKGIDLVFMGDAYVDKHMDTNGKYEQDMRASMEYFFEAEPYKSLRDRFNVYAVKVVSPNYEFASNSQHRINYDDNICFEYASKINGIDLDKVTIVNVVNNSNTLVISGYTDMYESGASVAHIELGGPSSIIVHEAGGHGFAKLLDEYIYGGYENNIIPESEVENFNTFIKMNYHNRGWGVNVDTTNDPEKILWSHMLKDSRYSDEVGIYQGAWLYPYNLWRPSENSIMNDTFAGYFNAPSREAIYKAVMKLSEGDDWVYDYEEFVRFDKSVSTRSAQHTKTTDNRQIKRKEHKAPTIIKGSWRDAK